MTIILFLIDTSGSMNQKTYLGTSFLDLAKSAVDTFLKLRNKDFSHRGMERYDRYMLLSFEDPPRNIKSGWKENQAQFNQELKSLTAHGMTSFGPALANAFHLLNVNRLQSGVDTFGNGRCPFYLEPAMLIAITDGNSLTSPGGIVPEIELRTPPCIGMEFCSEPFRWDQRLFTLVLRAPGHPPSQEMYNMGSTTVSSIPHDMSPVNAMCEVTGGRSFTIFTQRALSLCVETLVGKIQNGVVLNFDKTGPDPVLTPAQLAATAGAGPGPSGPNGLPRNSSAAALMWNGSSENENQRIINNAGIKDKEFDGLDNGFISDPLKRLENNKHLNNVINQQRMNPTLAANSGNSPSHSRSASPMPGTLIQPPDLGWYTTKGMVFVPRIRGQGPVGHWPMPESHWPDVSKSTLEPRSAQPVIRFKCEDCEPMVLENFPFDKYELEPSPLTVKILERKQPTTCWQVFLHNSGKYSNDIGAPFGYLKASTNLSTVNLFVMPYNYPKLLPIMKDLQGSQRAKPGKEWRASFDKYLKTIPAYYYPALKKAFLRMGLTAIMPEQIEPCVSYSVLAYLKRVKLEARSEYERLCAAPNTPPAPHDHMRLCSRSPVSLAVLMRSTVGLSTSLMARESKFTATNELQASLRKDINDFPGLPVPIPDLTGSPASRNAFGRSGLLPAGLGGGIMTRRARPAPSSRFRNPFDIPRSDLVDQIAKMRKNLTQHLDDYRVLLEGGPPGSRLKIQNAEELHSVPIDQMGNYHAYVAKAPVPLREIEAVPVRQHAFGNPFKVDKRMMVDEADMDMMPGSSAAAGGGSVGRGRPGANRRPGTPVPNFDTVGSRKRKPGPLPHNFRYKRRRPGDDSPRLSPIAEPMTPIVELSDDDADDVMSTSSRDSVTSLERDARDSSVIQLEDDDDDFLRLDLEEPVGSLDAGDDLIVVEEIDLLSPVPEDESMPVPMPSAAEMLQIRHTVARLVRTPRPDLGELSVILNGLPSSARRQVAPKAYDDAKRFKRFDLCEKLRPFLQAPPTKTTTTKTKPAVKSVSSTMTSSASVPIILPSSSDLSSDHSPMESHTGTSVIASPVSTSSFVSSVESSAASARFIMSARTKLKAIGRAKVTPPPGTPGAPMGLGQRKPMKQQAVQGRNNNNNNATGGTSNGRQSVVNNGGIIVNSNNSHGE